VVVPVIRLGSPRCARSYHSWPNGSNGSPHRWSVPVCAILPVGSAAPASRSRGQPRGARHRRMRCTCLGLSRRDALWAAGAAAHERSRRLPCLTPGVTRRCCRPGTMWRRWWSTLCDRPVAVQPPAISPEHLELVVAVADRALGARPITKGPPRRRHRHPRQRPRPSGGNHVHQIWMIDRMLNVVCSPGLWHRHRRSPARLAMLIPVDGIGRGM